MTAEPDSTDQNDQAIITFPSLHRLRDVSLTKLESDDVEEIDLAQQQFQIRLANSQGVREKASLNSLAQRACPRVNAPAVLLALKMSHMFEQIRKYRNLGPDAKNTKSIYPYFFSPTDEVGITQRLVRDGYGPTTLL